MVSGIHNLWSLISGTVIPAYGGPEGGYVVRADGCRRKWWRRCRCPVVCVRTLCNGLLPCGSGSCRSGAASLSGGKSGKSGGKSGRCRAAAGPLHPPPLLMVLLLWNVSLLSSSFLFSSCVASNKNKNIIELQFSIHIFLHWCCRYGVGVGWKGFDQSFAF